MISAALGRASNVDEKEGGRGKMVDLNIIDVLVIAIVTRQIISLPRAPGAV